MSLDHHHKPYNVRS